ncbi:MAG: hypothetical protein M1832_002571, partial [Thelocarpon impressellum]
MADIDADLLALAGDSSSEEARSPSPAVKAGVRKRTKRASRNSGRHDSAEEGEASSVSSRSSLRSASMSRSDSEAETTGPGRTSNYPLEGKFRDASDRAQILALPEISREQILAERATIIEREQQNRMLVQLLRDKERKESRQGHNKRDASDAELDESQRKSARQKTTLGGRKVGEASAPLEAYKKQREQRGIQIEQRRREDDGRAAAASGRRRDSRDSRIDGDGDGEDHVEWDDDRPRADARRSSDASDGRGQAEQAAAVKHDFDRAKIGRTGFAKVCFYPGFEEAITGCFTRLCIGNEQGENVYRVCQIKRFTEGKPYAMETENGSRFVTTQYALLAHGKAEREWPFILCSNEEFSERELERYRKTCAFESVPVPDKAFLDGKVHQINALIERRWTEEELQAKLRRSGAFQAKDQAFDRSKLMRRRHSADKRGDDVAVAELDDEIAKLDGPKLAWGTTLHPKAAPKADTGPSQQERLAEINRRNRIANTQNVRKAQIAEIKAERLHEAAVARGEAQPNPFARVKTRAKIMHDVNDEQFGGPKKPSPPPPPVAGPADSDGGGAAGGGRG